MNLVHDHSGPSEKNRANVFNVRLRSRAELRIRNLIIRRVEVGGKEAAKGGRPLYHAGRRAACEAKEGVDCQPLLRRTAGGDHQNHQARLDRGCRGAARAAP